MATIKKAKAKDAEKILPLFSELNNPYLTREDWQRLFQPHWDDSQDYCGYVMYDGDQAVGFLGLLFSQRIIHGKETRFCNVSSWVVKGKYRRQSLYLLLPVLELHNHTITILTCSADTYLITKKLGFRDLEFGQRVILPIPCFPALISPNSIMINDPEIEKTLKGVPLKIFRDHQGLKCFHVMINSPQGVCYLVVSRTHKKRFPFAHIHYISNHQIFMSHISRVSGRLCWRMKVVALLVDERLLLGGEVIPSIYFNLPHPRVYKSDTWKSEEVDTLYSEYQVLNL